MWGVTLFLTMLLKLTTSQKHLLYILAVKKKKKNLFLLENLLIKFQPFSNIFFPSFGKGGGDVLGQFSRCTAIKKSLSVRDIVFCMSACPQENKIEKSREAVHNKGRSYQVYGKCLWVKMVHISLGWGGSAHRCQAGARSLTHSTHIGTSIW